MLIEDEIVLGIGKHISVKLWVFSYIETIWDVSSIHNWANHLEKEMW